jgi:hypothetical protein
MTDFLLNLSINFHSNFKYFSHTRSFDLIFIFQSELIPMSYYLSDKFNQKEL